MKINGLFFLMDLGLENYQASLLKVNKVINNLRGKKQF